MNGDITKQDLIDLFIKICPEVQITEEQIETFRENIFEDGTSFDTARDFLLHKAFLAAIDETILQYNKEIMSIFI
jgi:hypothetical protein